MKTTVEIPDGLLIEAKRIAREENLSLRTLIERGLRWAIRESRARKPKFRLRDGSFRGEGLVQERPWSEIRDMVYEGHAG